MLSGKYSKAWLTDKILNVIISFHEGMKTPSISNGEYSESFGVKNGTKQGCVMAPLRFALFFSIMLHYAVGDLDMGVKFEFRTSGGIFNYQRFKAKSQTRARIIRDL